MPRVSKKRIKEEIKEELKGHFAFLISSLNNSKEIEQFFQDFLTSEEKTMLTKRLMLHLMLENKYESYKIESVIGVSYETIRIHKNIWSKGGENYKRIINKIANRERTKRFFEKLEKFLKPISLVLKAKTDMRARAKLASGDWSD